MPVTLRSLLLTAVAVASAAASARASAQSDVVKSHARPLQSRVIISPVEDTILDSFMPVRANYQCTNWLLYDQSGPMSVGCSAMTGDTLWVVYQDTTMHGLVAAAKNIAVPLDSLDAVAVRLENELTIRFGRPDSCNPQAQTLRHWRWWAAGKYTVQLRIVDPTSVYRRVRRGRVELQAIPPTATVCLTWVHEPLPPE